jgi:hypothetical protein
MDKGDDDKGFMRKKGKKHIIHYELNPSNTLLFEDHLKRCLNKTSGQNYKELRNKFAPKNKHSPFGDFPREFIPRKEETFELINIDSHQVANSVSAGQKNVRREIWKIFQSRTSKTERRTHCSNLRSVQQETHQSLRLPSALRQR